MARFRTFAAGVGPYWALGFAALHLYWAGGGRLGVPTGTSAIADRRWFLAYDLIAAAVFLIAAVIGRLLLAERLSWPRRRLLRTLTLIGAVAALIRAWVGLAQDAVLILLLHRVEVGMVYDLWFLVAGLVFLPVAREVRADRAAAVVDSLLLAKSIPNGTRPTAGSPVSGRRGSELAGSSGR